MVVLFYVVLSLFVGGVVLAYCTNRLGMFASEEEERADRDAAAERMRLFRGVQPSPVVGVLGKVAAPDQDIPGSARDQDPWRDNGGQG